MHLSAIPRFIPQAQTQAEINKSVYCCEREGGGDEEREEGSERGREREREERESNEPINRLTLKY